MWVIISFTLAIFICLLRVAIGPTFADRVVSGDTAVTLMVGLLTYLSFYFNLPFLLDIGIVFAILSFIGTIAIARYMKGELK